MVDLHPWRGPDITRNTAKLFGAPRPERSKGLSSTRGGDQSAPGATTTEIMHSPITRGQRRSGRLAPGRWAGDYDACIDCGTSERPHRAHGRCKRRDDRWRNCTMCSPAVRKESHPGGKYTWKLGILRGLCPKEVTIRPGGAMEAMDRSRATPMTSKSPRDARWEAVLIL